MHAHLSSRTPLRHLLLGLALLPAGCYIHSDVPLSDPDKATPNEKLLGKWVSQSNDNPLTLTVEKAPPAGYPAGVLMLSFGDENPDNYTLFFSTELRGKTYVNLCGGWVRSPAQLPAWDKARKGPFGIVKYAVAGDIAVVWDHDESLLQESVRRGKLKGIIKKPAPGAYGWPFALLQESTADLALLVLREDKNLFPTRGALKRVK
jgi:hypothetical protein